LTSDAPTIAAGAQLARQLQTVDWGCAWWSGIAARSRQWQEVLPHGAASWRAAMNRQTLAQQLAIAGRAVPLPVLSNAAEATDPAEVLTLTPTPLRFVAQDELPPGAAYEAHIAASGAVPTRTNLHDFFNAAIWFAYPRIKAALNARQARQIAADGIQPSRGGVRDALTLFDENAVLLACADRSLSDALRAFDWHTLFVERRAAWGRACEARPFGHALLEKLVAPYKAITAHTWIVEVPPVYFDWPEAQRQTYLDRTVAPQVALLQSPRDFTPLPVLGIPGWWGANADAAFYADPQVFRSRRRYSA
jgi:hypothetical protein